MHEGLPIKTGKKYILRTDVMYRLKQCKNEKKKRELFDLYDKACKTDEWDEYHQKDIDYSK